MWLSLHIFVLYYCYLIYKPKKLKIQGREWISSYISTWELQSASKECNSLQSNSMLEPSHGLRYFTSYRMQCPTFSPAPRAGLLALSSCCSHSALCLCFRRGQLDQGYNFLGLLIIILMLKCFRKSKRKTFMMFFCGDFSVKGERVIMVTVQFLAGGRKEGSKDTCRFCCCCCCCNLWHSGGTLVQVL